MKVFVGTSGWYYDWNEDKTLDWFTQYSGLNSIELNASFYRFPFPNQIMSWAKRGAGLRWSVKVHRSVSHAHRFNEQAIAVWKRFQKAFIPLDSLVDFYLFLAPPSLKDESRLLYFIDSINLVTRCALEIRNVDLLSDNERCTMLQEHAILVSVDSPDIENRIFPGDTVYLRLHGRKSWYSHNYSADELTRTAGIIMDIDPERVYVYFNNDQAMLQNARTMLEILTR